MVIQELRLTHLVAPSCMICKQILYTAAGGEEMGDYREILQIVLGGSGPHTLSVPLVGIQSHDCTSQQGRLGSVG